MRVLMLALALATFHSTPGFTAQLLDEEKIFVITTLITTILVQMCPDYVQTDPNNLVKFGDRRGVDGKRLTLAVAAALDTTNDKYDRDALIPEVTRWINQVLSERLLKEMNNKAKFCSEYSPTLLLSNIVKRK